MPMIDSTHLQWIMPRGGHRGGGVEFKTLFTGDPQQPGNYWFTLVRVRDAYRTPAHRHMFDQVRIMLEGGFNFGPQTQPEGSVGYFTEGTVYEQWADSYSFHLLLQTEGASRMPFIQAEEMGRATQALKTEGEFVDGVYRTRSGDEFVEKDGFEAIFERATGITPRYSRPRYERPVIMDPDVFSWLPDAAQPGVSTKLLGVFTERRLTISMVSIEPGATWTCANTCSVALLAYVRSGAGTVDGELYAEQAGLRIEAGTTAAISAAGLDSTEAYLLQLPS